MVTIKYQSDFIQLSRCSITIPRPYFYLYSFALSCIKWTNIGPRIVVDADLLCYVVTSLEPFRLCVARTVTANSRKCGLTIWSPIVTCLFSQRWQWNCAWKRAVVKQPRRAIVSCVFNSILTSTHPTHTLVVWVRINPTLLLGYNRLLACQPTIILKKCIMLQMQFKNVGVRSQ